MKSDKKNLLIFFGEYRTFDYVIPHLKKLDSVDIIFTTWSESKINNNVFLVNESKIKKILPNIKNYFITNQNEIPNIDTKSNIWKMFWHWKTTINSVIGDVEYDKVIVHRCDFISNWHEILDLELEKDTLYFHHGKNPYHKWTTNPFFENKYPNAVWINDFYFFGKLDIVKKFINFFNKDNYEVPHHPLYEALYENKINYKNHTLKGFLVRDTDIEYTNGFILRNEEISNESYLTGPFE